MSGNNTSGPYDPLANGGMHIVLYGASPYPYEPGPRWPGDGLPYWPSPMIPIPGTTNAPLTAEQFAELMKKLMEQQTQTSTPKVDPPPASAADSEVNAVNALAALTPEERARVLRFAVSKWGPVTI